MEEIIRQINSHECFYIFGHTDPDGDCVGSQLATGLFLRRLGKRVKLFAEGPFTRQEIKRFESFFETEFSPFEDENGKGMVIITDCSTPDRIGRFRDCISGYKAIIIDHHSSGSDFGDFRHVRPNAASNTLLIYNLIKEMGAEPTAEEAEILFLGLCTDTGFFKHLTTIGGEAAFTVAAELVRKGVSPNKVFFDINGNRKFDTMTHTARAISRLRRYYGDRLLITFDTMKDFEEIPKECRNIDLVYQLALSTENVRVIAAVKEENPEKITVGLRTRDENIDLGKFCAGFGGGGHRKAAGFMVQNSTVEAVIESIVEGFRPVLGI